MKKFKVDRIEDGFAVLECEDGEFREIPLSSLPKNISEGDVINFAQNSCFLNQEETRRRREFIKELMKKAFEE